MLVLEEQPVPQDKIRAAIRKGTIENKFVPVTCGTSYRNKGVQKLLDAVVDYMPSPLDIPSIKGIDPETGVASRDTQPLKDGDVIAPAYFVFSDEFNDYIYGDDITVSGDLQIEYDALPAADYSYSMSLYDIYGNYYYTTSVTFTVDENGELFFYPDEL